MIQTTTLRNWVDFWNVKYPIDLIWRLHNNVQFGSTEHKSMDFLSMLFSLMQDHDIAEYKKSKESKDDEYSDELSEVYKTKDIVKMSKEEVDNEFENLD